MSVSLVYEDNWLLVVNKPAGLLTIPTPKNERHTLTSILNKDIEKKGFTFRLHPCHRLDRETSGLIIYAKGKSSQKKIMELFKQKKIKKTYIAFVQGNLSYNYGKINIPIDGIKAITRFKVIEKRKDFSLVKVEPVTGRTNQIRIHFRKINHPIIGERKFAFARDYKIKANELCLHAKTLEFIHPYTHKPIILNSELPLRMKRFLEKHTV